MFLKRFVWASFGQKKNNVKSITSSLSNKLNLRQESIQVVYQTKKIKPYFYL